MNYATAFLGAATALLITLGSVVADEAAAPVEKDAAPAPQAEPAIDAKWASADAAQLRAEINKIGEQIRQKIGESMTLQQQVGASASNPDYTSEAIEKKRLEIKAMETALIQAKIELQAEVAKHPDVVALTQRNQTVLAEVDQLRKMKKAFAQRLAERLAGKGDGQ
ncbi:MAG: hypothetical protein PHW08_03795 [Kiritimatiellae bacterium]|nr:hypothetical protein [Kiritimatiellia bacterium]